MGSKQPGHKKLPAEGNTDTSSKQMLQIEFLLLKALKYGSRIKKKTLLKMANIYKIGRLLVWFGDIFDGIFGGS